MREKNNKRKRRVSGLIISLAFIGIILTVSTFAWFIGMRTVNVSSFDVSISSTDSLLLSLNGVDWDTTVSISRDTLDQVSYQDHTNWWAGKGLSPVSSVGDIDDDVSRLIFYEKASLTASPGGYRFMSSRVDNATAGELDGYVAFDLFIRNFSGAEYYDLLNERNEEAIYLSTDSSVTVSETGGVPNTGIENSVRVAFAQIGRVVGTTADLKTPEATALITGITCNKDGSNNDVTGICTRTAQIWEPNDTDHVKGAISWYNKSCKKRIAQTITDPLSYDGDCEEVEDGKAYPTYAVNSKIDADDEVDVYDGLKYNTYTASTKLTDFPYFTDTMKIKPGVERPQFMSLAPNSVTKVRVYIYIEGQDVDNYDFAAIGKAISVQFGFTKQRYTETDVEYEGPSIRPVITLLGDDPMTVALDSQFDDPGATATDNVDGNLTGDIVATGTVDTSVAGTYTITYRVTNSNGVTTTKTRTVEVQ